MYASTAIKVQETENIKRDAVQVHDRGQKKNGRIREEVERKDRRRERWREERNITVWLHYSKTVLHKRKCIQHHSPAIEETEIEKGKSEFAHLGKTSHWRQSISNSVLLKRARWKYSSSQHKRSWHTFQSIGYSHCAGKFLLKSICLKLRNLEGWRRSAALQNLTISLQKSNYL